MFLKKEREREREREKEREREREREKDRQTDRQHTAETAQRWVPRDVSPLFLVINLTQKMMQSSDSMYSSIFMPENMISSLHL